MKKENFLLTSMLAVAVLIVLVVIVILIDVDYSLDEENVNKRDLQQAQGAVTNIWINGDTRFDVLKEHDIVYLFVDVGGTNLNGTSKADMEQVESFYELIRDYEERNDHEFILLPYSEVRSYDIDTTTIEFRENFIDFYKELTVMGYDGLLVDIEPVQFEERDDFLNLLEELRIELGSEPIISVYAGHIGNGNNEWEWETSFYRSVAIRTDIISASGYDTDFTNSEEYSSHLKNQIHLMNTEGYDTNILFAIPTHRDYPEHSDIALNAIQGEFVYEDSPILGVTVFAEWTADENDWDNFKEFLEEKEGFI